MLEELILHIGPPKTATTSIQLSVSLSTLVLADSGIYVPLSEGAESGQHLPILRDLVGVESYAGKYAYSMDTLSFEATRRQFEASGCPRLLLSAEEFSSSQARDDVQVLIDALGPKSVSVVLFVRQPLAWVTSAHAQAVKGGLGSRSAMGLNEYAQWFWGDRLPSVIESIDTWRNLNKDFRVTVVFLEQGKGVEAFGTALGLTRGMAEVARQNERLDPCYLRLLVALNRLSSLEGVPMTIRALRSEAVRKSILGAGLPSHACDCARSLDSLEAAAVTEGFHLWLDALLERADRVIGSPGQDWLTSGAGIHRTFHEPNEETSRALNRVMIQSLDDVLARETAMHDAKDYWEGQASRLEEDRNYWKGHASRLEEDRDYRRAKT